MDQQLPDRVRLGRSDLQVSPLGLGTNSWGPGRRLDPGQQATVDAALEGTVNFFDTAEFYNFGGSERTLGGCLQKSRAEAVVATKFFPFPWRLGRGSLLSALRASLERLGFQQTDLYMLHFPFPPVPLATWVRALAEAQQAGLTRAVGISNCSAAQTRKAHALLAASGLPLASNQVEYSLLRRAPEKNGLLEICGELGVTLVAYRPLGYGLLSGKYHTGTLPAWLHGRRIRREYLERITPLIDLLKEIAAGRGKTPSQVALNWVICKGALPIPGAKRPDQAVENAGALGWRLDAGEVAALDKASLLP